MIDPREIEVPDSIDRKDYQIDALCGVVRAYEEGHSSALLVMPTGCGKTITAGLVAKYALEQLDRKILFVAHRSELIEQAEYTFVTAFGFAAAVEKAGQTERQFRELHGQEPEVVVATVQSLHERRLSANYKADRFGLIIIDEAHRSTAASYKKMLAHFDNYLLLGITATPDGATKALGSLYGKIAYQLRLRDAIRHGYLVPIIVRKIPVPVDLRELSTTGGDYTAGDLAERIEPAVESLCANVKANIGTRQTVIFTPDVGSAQACASMLSQMGVKAEYVAGEGGKFGVSQADRRDRLRRFRNQEYQVVVCCDLLVEGWDMPSVSCVVIARPTRKRSRYCQMVGRGTRLCAAIGKVNCLLLDLDWQADESSRELCRPHVLFAESNVSSEDIDLLGEHLAERQKNNRLKEDVNLDELLGRIQEDRHAARLIRVKFSGKHTKLYQGLDADPLGVGKVLDISLVKRRDFDSQAGGPASRYQVERLAALGVIHGERMSLWGASRLIQKLESRDKKGLASHQQVKFILAHGAAEDQARALKRAEASHVIAELLVKQQQEQASASAKTSQERASV